MLAKYFVVSVFWSVLVGIESLEETGPIVTIPNGKILGYYDETLYGHKFAAFEGIPFARPPIGKYRFERPKPAKPWKGIFQANQLYTCIQDVPKYFDHGGAISGQEDCLYINVYVPQLKTPKLLDVIVHIHGGGFSYNAPHQFGPKILMEREVVYVNFNHRVGALGYLSTEDEVVPGNNGLKDQILALEWINQNIMHFGGNPSSVTISGISSGGECVHLHYLSPLSKGLFHKGIAISGTALCSVVVTENALEKSKRLADSLGCETQNIKSMVNCLKSRPAKQIVQNVNVLVNTLFMPVFGPVVEKFGENPFLPATPYELMSTGQIQNLPIIMSITQAEGLIPGANFISDPKYLDEMETRWYELAPILLDYNFTVLPEDKDIVSKKIKDFYFKGKKVSVNTFKEFVQMLGDRIFVNDIEKSAILQAQKNTAPVYFYYLGYRGVYSKSVQLSGREDDFGVCHADDGIYIVSHDWATPEDSENDRLMKGVFQDMWTSFAKTGTPSIKGVNWNPLSRGLESLHYMHIASPEKISMQHKETFGNRQFWESLPIHENDLPRIIKEEL